MEDGTHYRQWEDKETLESKKGRARIYPTLRVALINSDYGDIVTTPKSDNIYVVTKGTWGKKSESKIVKSFSPDKSWGEIEAYSKRTKEKHGEIEDGLREKGGQGTEGEMGENQGDQNSGGDGGLRKP